MRQVVGSFLLVFMASSCAYFGSSPEIERIDSALTELEQIEPTIAGFDPEKLAKLSASSAEKLSFIRRNYPDSMSLDLALYMGDYRANKKRLNNLNRDIPHLIENHRYTTEQLVNLRNDVKHGYIEGLAFDTAFNAENAAVNQMVSGVNRLAELYTLAMKEEKARSPRVDSVVLSLRQRGYK